MLLILLQQSQAEVQCNNKGLELNNKLNSSLKYWLLQMGSRGPRDKPELTIDLKQITMLKKIKNQLVLADESRNLYVLTSFYY